MHKIIFISHMILVKQTILEGYFMNFVPQTLFPNYVSEEHI